MALEPGRRVHAGLGKPRVGNAVRGRPPELQGPVRPAQPVHVSVARLRPAAAVRTALVRRGRRAVHLVSGAVHQRDVEHLAVADRPGHRRRPGRPERSTSSSRSATGRPTRPAFQPRRPDLAAILNAFGDRYSKYVLNLNGHSHDYERFQPIHGVTHITAGGGGAALEGPWTTTDSRTGLPRVASRAPARRRVVDRHADRGRVRAGDLVGRHGVRAGERDRLVRDRSAPATAAAGLPILYVDQENATCSDSGSGTSAQPFCTISAAASRVVAGQTVLVCVGTYNERVTVSAPGPPLRRSSSPPRRARPRPSPGGTYGFYISGKNCVTVQGLHRHRDERRRHRTCQGRVVEHHDLARIT